MSDIHDLIARIPRDILTERERAALADIARSPLFDDRLQTAQARLSAPALPFLVRDAMREWASCPDRRAQQWDLIAPHADNPVVRQFIERTTGYEQWRALADMAAVERLTA